ncbi:glycoside hydrolase family 31 protein [Lentinula edodes]|uniref:Glycoside hydrolase family 31 protein n=1 Tax=Lentinula edodes TaxID=5353 RepID=A0A1Q3EGD5_LENED|nr:glycoside hydrolase family 31 protein [Lentinula edodes]
MLGGFYPFMRNHNADTSISQEFYRWPVTAQAAKNVLDIWYRLMEYFYTTFHPASLNGSPILQALWYKYPKDTSTYSSFVEMPVHIVGGFTLPLHVNGAMTTKEVRRDDFRIVVAPNAGGNAAGRLYVDDGVSLEQANGTTALTFDDQDGALSMNGTFGYNLGVNVASVKILDVDQSPKSV